MVTTSPRFLKEFTHFGIYIAGALAFLAGLARFAGG